jgi:hypothetical protein
MLFGAFRRCPSPVELETLRHPLSCGVKVWREHCGPPLSAAVPAIQTGPSPPVCRSPATVVQGAIVTVSLPSMTHCPPRRKYKAGSHPPRQRRAPQARLARQESEDRQIGDLRLGTRRRPSGHFQCEYAPQRDRLAQARRPWRGSRRHDGGGAMPGRNGDLLRQAAPAS